MTINESSGLGSKDLTQEVALDELPEDFKNEIRDRLRSLQSQVAHLNHTERGGHPDHPLGEHPCFKMQTQYQAARHVAIKSMQSESAPPSPLKYVRRLVYPSYGFVLKRIIVAVFFVLTRHRHASYPMIGISELMYLYMPTFLIRKLRYLLAKIEPVTSRVLRD